MTRNQIYQVGAGVTALIGWIAVAPASPVNPTLSLTETGNGKISDTIAQGTPTFSLNAVLSTGGNTVSGVQYAIDTTGPASVTYGSTPLTALSNPFTSNDIALAPTAGATVQSSGNQGTTAFFKNSSGDYAAFSGNAIATYTFNTGSLVSGNYVFTPVGEEMTNGSGLDTTTFSPPGTFTLTVQSTPEPVCFGSIGIMGSLSLLRRRRRI